jgi:hypothetical protein
MARSALSPVDRASKVRVSAAALPALIQSALDISADLGYSHPNALAAWEYVEEHGATVHRQARLLAGKSRGG